MENIFLENKKLTIIKSNWFKCSENLKHLDLHSNEIASIDDDVFDKLVKLEKVNLHYNEFRIIEKFSLNLLRNYYFLIKSYNKSRTDSESMYFF